VSSALDLLKKVLKPISNERAEEIAHALGGPGGHEQLALEDAGLTDEVMAYIRLHEPERRGRVVSSLLPKKKT
jgi:hypothetical protein